MSDRVSQFILLCEDQAHERLAKAFLKICKLPTQAPEVKSFVASRMEFGGGVNWVLNEFPKQLHACRQRHKKAHTLLIVLVDSDHLTVDDRRRELLARVTEGGHAEFGNSEPAVLLIPKRHIETWLCALLGESVTEEEDCKSRMKLTKDNVRSAAQTLFEWSRGNVSPGPSCVPSLVQALPEWKRIG